jgi:hypothetical protein
MACSGLEPDGSMIFSGSALTVTMGVLGAERRATRTHLHTPVRDSRAEITALSIDAHAIPTNPVSA